MYWRFSTCWRSHLCRHIAIPDAAWYPVLYLLTHGQQPSFTYMINRGTMYIQFRSALQQTKADTVCPPLQLYRSNEEPFCTHHTHTHTLLSSCSSSEVVIVIYLCEFGFKITQVAQQVFPYFQSWVTETYWLTVLDQNVVG